MYRSRHSAHGTALATAIAVALLTCSCNRQDSSPNKSRATTAPTTTPDQPTSPATPSAAVTVTDVVCSTSIGPDSSAAERSRQFSKGSKIYLVTSTSGTATSAQLNIKIHTLSGTSLFETTVTVQPTGTTHTPFALSDALALEPGDYRISVGLNGQPVEEERIRVIP